MPTNKTSGSLGDPYVPLSQTGSVESASVVEDRETGRSRGFGFVEMPSSEERETTLQHSFGGENKVRAMIDRAFENIELIRQRMANDQIEIDALRIETRAILAQILA